MLTEFEELKEEFYKRNLMGIFMESFDVFHSLLKWMMTRCLPKQLMCNYMIWMICFWFVLPVGIKHGLRYINYGCVRNHKNKANLNHMCKINLPKKVD